MGMGRDSYFEDQWDFFRADLRAKDDKGWTDMELVGVDDDGLFSSIKVSVLFSLGGVAGSKGHTIGEYLGKFGGWFEKFWSKQSRMYRKQLRSPSPVEVCNVLMSFVLVRFTEPWCCLC